MIQFYSTHNRHASKICLFTIVIFGFCAPQTTNAIDTENNTKESNVDLALAVFERQYLKRAVIFKGECESANWKLFRKMMSQIQTGIVTPTTLWRLDYTFFRTGIFVDLRDWPIAKNIFREGAVQRYLNSTYRWLVVGETSLGETASLFQRNVFRLDTSVTVALLHGDSYVLSDLHRVSTSDAIIGQPIGRFQADQFFDWVDAENAPFRSTVHGVVPTAIHIHRHLMSEPVDVILERFHLLRGHPEVPGPYFAMKDFHVHLAVCDLYNISMKPIFYDHSGYPNEHGVYSGVLGGLQKHQVHVYASKILVDRERLRTCDPHAVCEVSVSIEPLESHD